MSDWGFRDRWDNPAARDKLRISFGKVVEWAVRPEGTFDPIHLEEVRRAAERMQEVVRLPDPSTGLKYMGGSRIELQRLVNLTQELRQRPADDPDRCNSALRTALRRADQFLTEAGATFQYC